MTSRGLLRLALPSKGRLAEPATRLLSDAGIQFETTGRTLHAHAHDLDLDLLLARSDDIPVWTAAGDVDLGIAGQNQIIETGADVEPLLELGFGRCRLALAIPEGAAIASLRDLQGARIATSYPRTLAARLTDTLPERAHLIFSSIGLSTLNHGAWLYNQEKARVLAHDVFRFLLGIAPKGDPNWQTIRQNAKLSR